MIIDAATPGDLSALHALHKASWANAYAPFVPAAALGKPLDDHMARTWASLPPGILCARGDGKLIGFLRLKPKLGWPYIDNLHVLPGLTRGGVGRALMGAACDTLTDGGQSRVWLTVLADNMTARRFYARMGGIETARIRETLLGEPVTTFPIVWTHLRKLRLSKEKL